MSLRLPLLASFVVLASCAATFPPCDERSCAAGCCSASGVCLAGRTVFECGLGGVACARCDDGLVCTAGACVAPQVDAGPADAGADDDGGVDAGPLDAGVLRLRGVTARRLLEYFDGDGGLTTVPGPLGSAALALEDADGGFRLRAPLPGGLVDARFTDVPEGRYLLRWGNPATPTWVQSDVDEVDLGVRLLGVRNSVFLANSTLRVDAGLPFAALPSDVLALTAVASGYVKDSLSLARAPGGLTVNHSGDLSLAVQPFAWTAGDELVFTLNRTVSDGGSFTAALAAGVAPAPEPVGLSGVLGVTLTPLPQQATQVSAALSDFSQFLGDVSPDAVVQVGRVLAASALPGGADGGAVDGRTALVWGASVSPTTDLAGSYTWGTPFGGKLQPLVRAALFVTVPLVYQGRTLNRSIEALATARFARDGGVTLRPALSAVRSLRLNGETAFVPRNGVSTTPTLSWLPPAQGAPTAYRVTVWRVSTSGSTLVTVIVAQLVTASTELRLPPDVLRATEAYSVWVTALAVPGGDGRARPLLTAAETDEATAVTAAFTP